MSTSNPALIANVAATCNSGNRHDTPKDNSKSRETSGKANAAENGLVANQASSGDSDSGPRNAWANITAAGGNKYNVASRLYESVSAATVFVIRTLHHIGSTDVVTIVVAISSR